MDDVFEPVFQHLESEIDYLSEWIPPLKRERRGLERWFQSVVVTPTLKMRGYEVEEYVRGDGPEQNGKIDLRLRLENLELLLELKAANDFRIKYVIGTERDGWIAKYLEQEQRPLFAGCLFLACDNRTKVKERYDELVKTLKNSQEMRGHSITLERHKEVTTKDGHYYWVLGLLATPYGRTLLARGDEYER